MEQFIDVQTFYPEKKRKNNWLLIGKESVGKTALTENLVGKKPNRSNFQGSSLFCQEYSWNGQTITDTPGIQTKMDSVVTSQVLSRLKVSEHIILTVKASDLASDLSDLWHLVQGQCGIVILTHWDMVKHKADVQQELAKLRQSNELAWITVDNRHISPQQLQEIEYALSNPSRFPKHPPKLSANWSVKPKILFFERTGLAPLISFLILVLPAWFAVTNANAFADWLYPTIEQPVKLIKSKLSLLPEPLNQMMIGDYGLVAMLPFLILYALPTVVIFSIIISLYKTTGLIDRLSYRLDPVMHKIGLSGRDLVRVIMGFGCNVPAIIQTRNCSCCTRGSCVSAISFGSACSYQLPATVAVFSAAGKPYLTLPYLVILAVTTCIYLIVTTSTAQRKAAASQNLLNRGFLQPPNWRFAMNEMSDVIRSFFTTAFPLFIVICLVAGFLAWLGVFEFLTVLIAPFMSAINLPEGAAIAVILGAIRKDGLAIGLIDSGAQGIKLAEVTDLQLLCTVYLAGVMLPCLVSLLTIIREMRWRFASQMVFRQISWAIIFTMSISWGFTWIMHWL
ncbi:nucleoside recognition domain-containing protein [Pseudoalteromonas luteoviolacea]|uniref:nucleoside recognition domain-containing protein n=1 Tax=Pseudoalteromonas luteoviolacea TaxID=43657 RepID=UPI001B390C1B|nr:nucleoside recognition domain-containing protein [Pseudoalteromonas luteoviolacea]MBQ4835509.1 50S ribosome-binding GTPase [Pseudoalteromonas luteoviolacea]